MALVKNQDLIDMARLGRAAKPIDLMDYAPEDGLPSAFLLHESKRQSVLTVFNWTDKPRSRQFSFGDLGLAGLSARSKVVDILENQIIAAKSNSLSLDIQPHSVRMVKIVDSSIAPAAPAITTQVPPHADAGSPVAFSAASDPGGIPALAYRWDFGDGSDSTGPSVLHSYTRAGDFRVHLVVEGIENVPFEASFTVSVRGEIEKHFQPDRNRRFTPAP
jgi:hypothetical protein